MRIFPDLPRWRFLLPGFAAGFGTLWFLDCALPGFQSSLMGTYALTLAAWAIAFSVGGFVTGRGFLVPALASTFLAVGVVVVHTAYLAGQYGLPVFPVIANNLPLLAITLAATAIGASVGTWLAVRIRRSANAN